MSTKTNRILGLDLGIGSIGWAVIDSENRRIDDLGVRIFSSGEEGARKAADRASQQRRAKRSVRRQTRRRRQRKTELKSLLQEIGLISVEEINQAYRTPGFNPDVFALRSKALTVNIQPIEIASVLINFANYRGYRDFYEDDEMMREGTVKKAMNAVQEIFEAPENAGKWVTVGQMIVEHHSFRNEQNKITFRNRNKPSEQDVTKKETNYKYLIPRRLLFEEANIILKKQAEYYDVLSSDQIDRIVHVIFRQRAFEDGPGPNKTERPLQRNAMMTASQGLQKYSGFEEMVGACPFYPEEKRGTKNSQLYDMYVLVNNLSQYSYQKDNRNVSLPPELLDELRKMLFEKKGEITVKELKEICKKNGIIVIKGDQKKTKLTVSPFVKFLCDDNLFSDAEIKSFLEENYMDETSFSHRIGVVLTRYITPSKRKDALVELLEDQRYSSTDFVELIKNKKFAGGAGVSDRYMKEAIRAFNNGQKYGDFQTKFLSEKPKSEYAWSRLSSKGSIRPIGDPDLVRNPVVYRSINEARKLINAIRRCYPGIIQINIELAREIGKSLETRKDISKNQQEKQKENEALMSELMIKLSDSGYDVALSDNLFIKYKLWKDQEYVCLYSGKEISFPMLINNATQVDHIVPQSIVLDETIHNKALVISEENQRKGNRLPLEYMDHSQTESYINRVASLHRKEKISDKKEKYLRLETLDDETVSGFVDRNINDARYISKYVANLLRAALSGEDEPVNVYVLNGSVTSRFRRYWLGSKYNNQKPSIYGLEDKGRELHYYHHAIDAVVIANLTRRNIEIAQDYIKLEDMRKEYRKNLREDNAASAEKISREIDQELQNSVEKLCKHYRISPDYAHELLNQGSVPSIINNLREEVEVRIPLKIDFDEKGYSRYNKLNRDLERFLVLAKEELSVKEEHETVRLREDLVDQINEIISEIDPEVAALTRTGEIIPAEGEEKKISLKDYVKKRKPKDLLSFIQSISMCSEEEYARRVSEYYQDEEFASMVKIPYVSFKVDRKFRSDFTASENPVALSATGFSTYRELEKDIRENLKSPYYVRFNKGIGETGNFTIYEARSYYCLEIYSDGENRYGVRGIRYVDVYKKNGKLCLKKPLPEGCQHVIYIFQNEYIRAYNPKGNLRNNGFGAYRGVENINQCTGKIRLFSNYGLNGRDAVIGLAGPVEKVEISLLGHIMGTMKCGDQSLFMTEKK